MSPVQYKALMILNYLDDIKQHEHDWNALKRAFLSSGMGKPEALFPEQFGTPSDDKEVQEMADEPEGDDVHYDYSGVTWKSGGEAFEEYQQLMSEINSLSTGTLSGDSLATDPEYTEWR